ncbi:hypothetical protein D3C80_764060 [compost metagenome]
MVDFAHQRVLLVQRLQQGLVAAGDGFAQRAEGARQDADLGRGVLGLDRAHREAAARVDGGHPLQIAQPAHDDALGHQHDGGEGGEPGRQRQQQGAEGVEPRPGQQAGRGRRQKDEDVAARQGRSRIDVAMAVRVPRLEQDVVAAPDVGGPVGDGLTVVQNEGGGRGRGQDSPGGVGQRGLGADRQGGIANVGLQRRQRQDGGHRSLERAHGTFGADGDHQGARLAGGPFHRHVLAASQAPKPGLLAHVGGREGRGRARGADRLARGAVAGQGGDAVQPIHQGGQARLAVEADAFGGQGLQQDHGAVDAGLGVGGAAVGGELQVDPLLLGLTAEAGLGLDHGEQQDGQQGDGHGHAQAKADSLHAGPSEPAPQNPADPQHDYSRPAPLSLSASARMERIASPADFPSRA